MRNAPPPMAFVWTGEVMAPRHPTLAARYFGEGEVVTLEVREDRSSASHRHYFAAIAEAHANLPEAIIARLKTPDHLRKYALIRTGYYDERSVFFDTPAAAERAAILGRTMDEFAIVTPNGPVVTVFTAKSQSVKAMPKGEFQASKDAVLEFIAQLLGTDRASLEQHAKEMA